MSNERLIQVTFDAPAFKKQLLCRYLSLLLDPLPQQIFLSSTAILICITMLLSYLYALLAVGATLSQPSLLPRLPILQQGVCR